MQQPLESDTDARLHKERIIAVQEEAHVNRYVERSIVEKCPMQYESFGRHRHSTVTSIDQSKVEREFLFNVTSFDSLSL